jgi:ketol-acid reductoisomerase
MNSEITLIGYGNQGKAWAANLRDSGWTVRVSGRSDGHGMKAARNDGFALVEPSSLNSIAGLIAILLPDESIASFFGKYLSEPKGAAGDGRSFLFAHGFCVAFGKLPFAKKDDVILVAPKGIGTKLRENYVNGGGVLGVLGVEQDASGRAWQQADLVAHGLGLDRVGTIRSSFMEETKVDLLSEQAVLCGAVPKLVESSVDFLVKKGIHPRIATYECLNELKLIVDMMVDHGIHGMYQKISTAAKFGGLQAADQILPDAELQPRLEILWKNIENGSFAEKLSAESESGKPFTRAQLEKWKTSVTDQFREGKV